MTTRTSDEATVTIWGDRHLRQASARLVSDFDSAHEADIHVDVVDFNDDQEPTVAFNVGTRGAHCLYLTAYDAERLGAFLIQAAALSRQGQPGRHDPLLVRHVIR